MKSIETVHHPAFTFLIIIYKTDVWDKHPSEHVEQTFRKITQDRPASIQKFETSTIKFIRHAI